MKRSCLTTSIIFIQGKNTITHECFILHKKMVYLGIKLAPEKSENV